MAGHSMINESADDGVTGEFWNEFVLSTEIDDVDDDAVDVIQQRLAELAARNSEQIRRINAAWNCGPSSSSASVQTQPTRTVTPRMPRQAPNLSPPTPDPTIPTRNSSSQVQPTPTSSSPSQRPITVAEVSQTEKEPAKLPSESNGNQTMARFSGHQKRTARDDDDGSGEEGAEVRESDKRDKRRSRYHSRSRSPSVESRRRRHRSRSRRRSRSRSRSRRYRSRSRSRRRSRTRSRSRSCSRDSRGRTRNRSDADRSGPSGELSMMQTMMTMMMQMIDKSSNQSPATASVSIPEALSNLRTAASSTSEPTFKSRNGEEADRGSRPTFGSTKTPSATPAAYDVGTELFLKGDINFGEYLALKPSSREDSMVTPSQHVASCISEAISILARTETKEQTGKFLYVPPTYNSELTKKDNRSPLIWNTHNVLFRFSSSLREVDLCEPFPNVNKKLKTIIADLGLDEGIIAHQLEQSVKAAKARAALSDASSQIQAIIAPSELTGPGGPRGRRHMIERAVQTSGYACGECVERSKRTYASVGVQTKTNIIRQADAIVQTSNFNREEPRGPTITLTNMSPNQIELIETIVNYVRQRQITGSVESVSNALRRDSAAPAAMGREMYDSIQLTLGQAAGLANRASMNTRNLMSQQQPMPPVPAPPPPSAVGLPMQAPKPNDPRLGARVGNYRGFQGSRQQQQQVQLIPAGFAYDGAKKNKKRK
ncbi:uncharacterized protein LOC118459731 [Anopheles albimanus]|uniref:Uncharacterized protein n=1 Tax=Anopheles albimanus TaxID=7167 RepID=A0A182F9H5_ANOAL|nr:uncharacterized protein LOC118459731 [Anopheles albimanus]